MQIETLREDNMNSHNIQDVTMFRLWIFMLKTALLAYN
jgi:hypothetical protein